MKPPLTVEKLSEMKTAIGNDDSGKIHQLAEEDARLLLFAGKKNERDFLYPLRAALLYGTLAAAEAILQEMRQRDSELSAMLQNPKTNIDPDCELETAGQALYTNVTNTYEGASPHLDAKSPPALLLLKKHGYDFKHANGDPATPHPRSAVANLLEGFIYTNNETPLEEFREFLQAALHCDPGKNPGTVRKSIYLPSWSATEVPFVSYAFNALADGMDNKYCKLTTKDALEILQMLPAAGIDFRNWQREVVPLHHTAMDGQNHMEVYVPKFVEWLRLVFHVAPQNFLETRNPDLARISASTGTLPRLLHCAIRQGDESAVAQAHAALNDEWRDEYRHSFRIAQAALARTLPAEETALAGWARSIPS